MCLIPDLVIVAVDNRSCASTVGWEDSTIEATVTHFQPYTYGATCCTTCLWSSHTTFCVDSQINPLVICVIQGQCTVHLTSKILFHVCLEQKFKLWKYPPYICNYKLICIVIFSLFCKQKQLSQGCCILNNIQYHHQNLRTLLIQTMISYIYIYILSPILLLSWFLIR